MQQIYLDNAATTQVRKAVVTAMASVLESTYGNPSSPYALGRASKVLIERSRKAIAKHLGVSASEILFTSGGTEADNLVLRSAVRDLGVKHIITSHIEHHAVLHTVAQLEQMYDIKVHFVKLDSYGMVDYQHLEQLLGRLTHVLVSLMHVNNEVGNILDLNRVGDLCRESGALFHSDTVQSIGHYDLNLQTISLDFLAASAHKFHGPKGIGFAFVRKGIALNPVITGGGQERGLRAGTEAVHNIVGLQVAMDESYRKLKEEQKYIQNLKQYFISQLKTHIPNVMFNGHSEDLTASAYTILNVQLPVPQEKTAMFLFQLDLKGIACSKGSACQSGSAQNSHVLGALLNAEDLRMPSIRFSFSMYNTKAEIDYTIGVLKSLI